ncbi:ribonuclease domain-containing protein [Chitiniphilus eburneus]|uniref:Ribonuclease n=1 Tax=Chitiniphilus eburneus TaxID=2571148 RepID=A0A4U0PCF3_9NEIS|nr:ribonuclease domain-containing protein [Chitiniphilus eburneus]TJZ65427.1 ribonuclease [Chitiniphilus eburneus]
MRGWLFALLLACLSAPVAASGHCRQLAETVARQQRLDAKALGDILTALSREGRLPANFVTKQQAQRAGWRPGHDLWQVLPHHSIGGDRFGNRERRLPKGDYREADLDYQGGKRGAKRLVYEAHGRRFVTTDHYQTFNEIPACEP